uniref:non-specific serine/threonine protein kinase n=1 Tax=Oryza glumipatula TaxID=40148 RepID=A0A0E0AS20_9ORYZ
MCIIIDKLNVSLLVQLCRYIDSCGLSGDLPLTLSKLKNLRVLRASDNDFTGKIPDYIGNLSNLEELKLQGNKIEGPIPASLSKLVKLNKPCETATYLTS